MGFIELIFPYVVAVVVFWWAVRNRGKKGRRNLMKVKVIQDPTVEPSIVWAGA